MPFPYAFKYTLAVLYEPLSLYTMFYTMFSSTLIQNVSRMPPFSSRSIFVGCAHGHNDKMLNSRPTFNARG